MSNILNKDEQYKCRSYYNDENELVDCTCGKCGIAKEIDVPITDSNEELRVMSDSKSTEELRKQIREIMREWEDMFPFPDPDDAGEEARVSYEVPTKLIALFDQELAKHVEAAVREALEPKRVACTGRIACSKCGHETLFENMHLFPDDIISLNQPTKERMNRDE